MQEVAVILGNGLYHLSLNMNMMIVSDFVFIQNSSPGHFSFV